MKNKETVTMYQISKELAVEKELNFVEVTEEGIIKILEDHRNVFDNFKREQVKKLTALLKVKGVEKSAIKNEKKEFEIPIKSKDYIKFLLLNYTSSPIKSIRKVGLENLPYSQWSELIKGLVDYSIKNITDPAMIDKVRNKIYADHQYFSIERHHDLMNKFSILLKNADLRYGNFEKLGSDDLNELDVINDNDNMRMLNENDVIELYDFLEKKIYECFSEFGKLIDTFSDVRHAEIEDKVIQALNNDLNPDDIKYDDSNLVLRDALRDFNKV